MPQKSGTGSGDEEQDRVARLASLHGLSLDVHHAGHKQPGRKRNTFRHWRFLDNGRIVLHYWPTTGKVFDGSESGTVDSPEEALNLAVQKRGN